MFAAEFYSLAKAYDIAFSDRYFDEETDFLIWCFDEFGDTQPEDKPAVLELGCGPANHAREFLHKGWQASALDISQEMLDYAAGKDGALKCEYIKGDMRSFSVDREYDLVINMMESITHIVTNEDMLMHFKSVAASLKEAGVYIIETAHPWHFFPDDEQNGWTSKEGDTEVEVLFGKPDDEYNSVEQVWSVTTEIALRENGSEVMRKSSISKHRWYLCQELKALIELSDAFSEYHFFGNMEIPPHQLDDTEESDSMIIVLRK